MDKTSYADLIEALNQNIYTIIVAVVQNGKLIDWAPAEDYCMLQSARINNEWPRDAELSLIYGLDALAHYPCAS